MKDTDPITDQEDIRHPLWDRLENWRDWQITLPAAGPEKKPKLHESEGTIEVQSHADAMFLDPILAEYKIARPKKYKLITSELLQREWVPDQFARDLGINRRTYNIWRVDAINEIQQMIDDKTLLEKFE